MTNGTVATQGGQIATLRTGIVAGTIGVVRQSQTTGDISVAANGGGHRVSVAGQAGDRVVSGVAAGVVRAGSNEAVNGGQLQEVRQEMAVGQVITSEAVNRVQQQVNQAFGEIDRVRGGVAIAMAMGGFALNPGKSFGISVYTGSFDNKHAYSVQTAAKINDTWTVTGGVGISTDGGRAATRFGVSAQW